MKIVEKEKGKEKKENYKRGEKTRGKKRKEEKKIILKK